MERGGSGVPWGVAERLMSGGGGSLTVQAPRALSRFTYENANRSHRGLFTEGDIMLNNAPREDVDVSLDAILVVGVARRNDGLFGIEHAVTDSFE